MTHSSPYQCLYHGCVAQNVQNVGKTADRQVNKQFQFVPSDIKEMNMVI